MQSLQIDLSCLLKYIKIRLFAQLPGFTNVEFKALWILSSLPREQCWAQNSRCLGNALYNTPYHLCSFLFCLLRTLPFNVWVSWGLFFLPVQAIWHAYNPLSSLFIFSWQWTDWSYCHLGRGKSCTWPSCCWGWSVGFLTFLQWHHVLILIVGNLQRSSCYQFSYCKGQARTWHFSSNKSLCSSHSSTLRREPTLLKECRTSFYLRGTVDLNKKFIVS